jgi:hypothetical protein
MASSLVGPRCRDKGGRDSDGRTGHSVVTDENRNAERYYLAWKEQRVAAWSSPTTLGYTCWRRVDAWPASRCSAHRHTRELKKPRMDHEEQVSQAGSPAAPAAVKASAVEKLEALGVRGILRQLAQYGQIVDVRCEMPQCYCFRGRRYFEPKSPRSNWSPTPDHYPRLRTHGGHLTPDNVRLAHLLCNRRDYGWRMTINAMLRKRMSLEEIAARLNAQKVPTIHGTNRWTASSVRKAFVS